MYPVALVLLVSLRTGTYGLGSALTAAYILGGAAGNPLLSRVADRAGQRAVLLPACIAHLAALGSLLVLAGRAAPSPGFLVVAAVLTGLTFPPVGALVRARWAGLPGSSPHQLGTGLAVESTFDEITFVVGPVLATVLATAIGPSAPFMAAAALVLGGTVALHLLRGTAPVARRVDGAPASRMPLVPTTALVLVMVAVGVTLVAVDLAAVAFVGQAGQTRWTGAVLACFALGSGLAGLAYGARGWRSPVDARLPVVAAVFAILPAVLLGAVGVRVLAVQMFVVGLGTAPLLITMFGLLERVAPAERLTEGLAWVSTGLNLGAGAAAPVVGVVADAHGARVALAIPLCGSVVAGLLALLTVKLARPHLRSAATSVSRSAG
jgi:MFS family permease